MKRTSKIIIPGWLISDFDLDAREMMLFSLIFGYINGPGKFYGSADYMAGVVKADRATVYRILKRLEDKGMIQRYGTPTEYAIGDVLAKYLEPIESKKPLSQNATEVSQNATDQSRNATTLSQNATDNKVDNTSIDSKSIKLVVDKTASPPTTTAGYPFKKTREEVRAQINEYLEQMRADKEYIAVSCKVYMLTPSKLAEAFNAFAEYQAMHNDKGWPHLSDFKRHFFSYVPTWKDRVAKGLASNGVGVMGQRK